METRNVHRGGTTPRVDRLTSRKAQAALALAVSLWIANGGVASAKEYVSANTTVSTDESGKEYVLEGNTDAAKGDGITFTVENGGTVKSISGNDVFAKSSGNTVNVIKGGTVNAGQGYAAIIGGFCNNEVTVAGTVTGTVYGGQNVGGESTNNHVVVTVTGTGTDTLMVSGVVYGGYGDTATGNKVEILGGHVAGVTGGYGDTTTNNTVVLHNATVDGGVKGGRSELDVTGNRLILSGVNNVGSLGGEYDQVKNFASIEFDASKLTWNTTAPVLTSKRGFMKCGVLDVSGVQSIVGTNSGTMTLLKMTGNEDENAWFNPPQKVAYTGANGKSEATLSAGSPVTVQSTAKTAGTGGVTIGYNSTHSVVRDDTNKAINYVVANSPVNNITLGTIAWNADEDVRNAGAFDGTGYDFSTAFSSTNIMNGIVSLDTTNFKLTVANEAAYKSMAPGASMTLINNATGLTGASGSYGSGFDYTVANGTKLDTWVNTQYYIGKNYPADTAHADKMTLDIGSVYIENVDLAGWDSTKGAFEMPNGWKSRDGQTNAEGPVPVTAAGFTAPTITAGTSQNIITTNTANFFSDDKITGALKYAAQASSTDTAKGVTFTGSESKGVKASDDGKNLIYARSNFNVSDISLGEMTWGEGRALTGGYDFANVANINAANLKFTNPDAVTGSGTLLSGASNLATGASIAHTQNFTKEVNGATLSATLSGNVTQATGAIGYTATDTTLNGVNLTGWNGTVSAIPTGWTANAAGVPVTAAGFAAPTIDAGTAKDILTTDTEGFFSNDKITGALKYAAQAASTDTDKGVTLTGSESKGVTIAENGKKLVYARSKFNVSKIAFGAMAWGTARDASAAGYNYESANIDLSKFTFSNPETISAGGTTTLLEANDTLAAIAATEKNVSYAYSPVDGVTVSGLVNGSYKTDSNAVKYTATANKANKLTFGNVAWAEGGTLMTRPNNITFAGADVDTSNINFTNISALEANKEMTLVANFCDTANDETVGTITGSKYKVGSTLQGEGKASLTDGGNLIFHTDTTAEKMEVQEQTHNTVMGAEVGMAALSAGNDFIASASEGLGLAANVGADGISSFATMGGGSMRQETGSHIDTRTWNAIIALGHKNEKEKSSFEYGAFFEYGRGNYTTYNGAERGDGSMHYTGGGLLAKWQKKDGLYVEGSLRAGSVHDDAHDVLRDVNGTPYSYETNAPYWGAHIGVGKIIDLGSDHELDVYGKFYHNHRKGVSFNAGGHYDLDAVNSDVLRIGARYTLKREKWNFYGGLAYEHELDGKASGTADGMKIRSADTSGASLRGELGVTFKPEKEGPLTLDFNVSGFAGKKRGVTGGVSVSLMF